MTILSTGPRVNGFLRTSETVVKIPTLYTNGSSIPAATAPRPGPSNLLSKFIEQFYELESYKYAHLFLVWRAEPH